MGRVGLGAYKTLQTTESIRVVGIEENFIKNQALNERGYHCVHGDASDRDFWERTNLVNCELILVSLSNHRENLIVVRLARALGFVNTLAVTARFPDEKTELESLGCVAFYLYEEVGKDFALHAQALTVANSAAPDKGHLGGHDSHKLDIGT